MKKFTKILLFVLMLALCVTAFSVVSFASEKEAEFLKLYSYDNSEAGSLTYEANSEQGKNGEGTFITTRADNGNIYIDHHVSAKVDTGAYASYLSGPYQANKKYSFSEYPYFAMDFDIAITAKEYAGASFQAIAYGYGAVLDDYGNTVVTYKGTESALSTSIALSKIRNFLPNEEFEWAHVTVVFGYSNIDYVEYISGYVYVNGVKVYEDLMLAKLNEAFPAQNSYFGTFRIGNSGGTNTANHSGYDNWQFNFFTDDFTLDEVGSYVYNGSYELPYGKTAATIGEGAEKRVFDSVPEAIAAAGVGETVKLVDDIEDTVVIDKSVYIDTNKYGEDGEPTGEYYSITYSSESHVAFENKVGPGIISFEQLQNSSVEIYWDDCPAIAEGGTEADCTCGSEYADENGHHIMAAYTETAMLGSTPVYPGEIPTFPIVNGVSKKFIGWSDTQGGEVIEIGEITTEDLDLLTLSFYPVYETLYYSYEVTLANGTVKYYLEKDFAAAFAAATTGATVKLLTDVTINKIISLNSSITVDFNGYDVKAYSATVSKYNATYDASKKTYVYDSATDLIESTGSSVDGLFSITHGATSKDAGITVTFKSSREGSDIYCLTSTNTVLVCDGEIVKTTSTPKQGYFVTVGVAKYSTINILGDGMTVYASSLVYSENHNNDDKNAFIVDGGTYYNVVDNYRSFIHWTIGGEVTVKNALFVDNSNGLLRTHSKNTVGIKATFDNCDFISANFRLDSSIDSLKFVNCRFYNCKLDGSYGATFGEGNLLSSDITASKGSTIAKGLEKISVSKTKTYTYKTARYVSIDPVTYAPTGLGGEATNTYTFAYQILDPVNGVARVVWLDTNGNYLTEGKAVKNDYVQIPSVKVPSGDGFRAVTNVTTWLGSDGKVSDLYIGDEDEYVFTAVLPAEADREYAMGLEGAMFNMTYYAHFQFNVYIPIAEGVTYNKLGSKTSNFATVYIKDKAYYVGSPSYADSGNAMNDSTYAVTYTIDGVKYTANFKISAYIYAMTAIDDPNHTAIDDEATGCLVRYIEESYKFLATDHVIDEATQAKFDAFYAKYTPKDYVTEYPEALNVDYSAVDELIESIHVTIYNGARVGFAVTLTDEAVAAGYKVATSGIVYGVLTSRQSGKVWHTDNVPLHSRIMNTFSIMVVTPESANNKFTPIKVNVDGKEVDASISYNLATYVVATNSDLAKALYAFGKAVKAVRDNIY